MLTSKLFTYPPQETKTQGKRMNERINHKGMTKK